MTGLSTLCGWWPPAHYPSPRGGGKRSVVAAAARWTGTLRPWMDASITRLGLLGAARPRRWNGGRA